MFNNQPKFFCNILHNVDILHLFGISNGRIASFDEFLLIEMSKSFNENGIWILKWVI
jgi:hypothetical protein